MDSLMFARPKTGYEAIKLFRLGERIAGTRDGTLALEDADFALVSDALNQNHAAYLAWVMGQAMAALIAWERDQ